MHYNNQEFKGEQSIINSFKKIFESVYTFPLPSSLLTKNFNYLDSIRNIDINILDVFDGLNSLNLN